MTGRKLIDIVYFKAGGGHISAMNALKEVLAERYPAWDMRPVDLADILKSIDPIYKATRLLADASSLPRALQTRRASGIKIRQSQDIYNFFLQHDMTRGFGVLLPWMQRYIRVPRTRELMAQLIAAHWQTQGAPDLVVSVIPNFNAILYDTLKKHYPAVPYVTVMTDMVDLPPHFWMEDQDQYIVCGTDTACVQARQSGFYDAGKIFVVSGMILKKSFYAAPAPDAPTLRDLGLSPDKPTLVIMFGGNGSSVSRKIVARLAKAKLDVQTLVMCGRNLRLYKSLQGKANCHAVGFVPNVADYMRLADIFIGKPGPGSLSEAVHMGCPVIVERNESTMPQESPNVDWVLENGVGLAVRDFDKGSEIVDAVRRMLAQRDIYRHNIERMPRNKAVYEIAALCERIMDESLPVAALSRSQSA
jgi:1,2-diacylglycerol 3-beta-galactosyltransferase